MKKRSLRILLNEVQTPRSDFLLELIKIFRDKPDVRGKMGVFLEDQIRKIVPNETEEIISGEIKKIEPGKDEISLEDILSSYKGKANKKRRNNAENQVINSLAQEFKGLDGSPVDFKLIKPLYHSILLFLKNASDSNFYDCILSADYYMKTFL